MNDLEKQVDQAIANCLDTFKGHVSVHRDFNHDKIVFHVDINGVRLPNEEIA